MPRSPCTSRADEQPRAITPARYDQRIVVGDRLSSRRRRRIGSAATDEVNDLDAVAVIDEFGVVAGARDDFQIAFDGDLARVEAAVGEQLRHRQPPG